MPVGQALLLPMGPARAMFASGSDRTCLGVPGSSVSFPMLLSLLLCLYRPNSSYQLNIHHFVKRSHLGVCRAF